MTECKINENKSHCNCSYSCNKKGLCCECLHYHLKRNEFPACFFPNEIEKTYNRSIENYIKNYNKKN
jgi:hypothetical protein